MKSNKIICTYLGDLKTESLLQKSCSILQTDSPLEHEEKGRYFCPTYLIATALGTCLLTLRGIRAKKAKWSLDVMKLEVYKQMSRLVTRKKESDQ